MKQTITVTCCILIIMLVNTFVVADDPSADDAVRSGVPAVMGWLMGRLFAGGGTNGT